MEQALDGKVISDMMEQEGPIVNVVVLRPSGEVEQIKLDMTPKANAVSATLGGPATFIGQYADIDVMVLKNREPTKDMPVNKTTLPAPFHEEETKGSILLVRMNEQSIPEEFTVDEFNKYVEHVKQNPPKPVEETAEEEGEEGEGEISSEEAEVMKAAVEKFVAENGRAPTAAELRAVLMEQYGEGEEEDEEEDDEEESEETKNKVIEIFQKFVKEHDRQPTPEELQKLLGEELLNDDSEGEAYVEEEEEDGDEKEEEEDKKDNENTANNSSDVENKTSSAKKRSAETDTNPVQTKKQTINT